MTTSTASREISAAPQVSLTLDSLDLAETYDRLGTRQYEHGKILIRELGVRRGQHVLDVGCGTALLTKHVADLVGPTGRVVGIDPLPPRIEVARRRARDNLTVQVGRAEDLSAFADETFDVIFYNSVFHWLPDKPLALREAHRVLKQGGRLGISSAAKEQPHDSDNLLKLAFGERDASKHHILHKVTSGELALLLGRTGFTSRQIIRTFTDQFSDVDEIIAFNVASSFGNAFSALNAEQKARAREALDAAAAKYRNPDGVIVLRRHLIFAVAEKRPQ
jgi:ubiquinone/menaquinone biosynthesis C-methylase UbiE